MDTVSTNPNTAPQLPLELLLKICTDVADSLETLAVLCRTWRAFLAPAQRLMYRDVDLEAKPMSAVRSWALAVTCRPRLAECVQSLAIQLPDVQNLPAVFKSQVCGAFAACVNITKLRFLRIERESGCNLDFVLHTCTFKLTHFTTSYFDFASFDLRNFLATQSELRFLAVLPGARIDSDVLEEESRVALPRLIGFKGDASVAPAGRPFQRLELSCRAQLPDFHQYAQTLTTLNLILDATQEMSLMALYMLAQTMPSIRHLGLMSTAQIRRLRQLQAVLDVTEMLPPTQWETLALVDRHTGAADEEELRDAAKTIVETRSSLRRAAVAAKVDEREKMCIATREADGEIQTVIEDKIDFEAVSMFWV